MEELMVSLSRMIVFLQCSTNNRASTVYRLFHNAVQTYGLPLRVRSDKGRENCDVAWFMLSNPLRGPKRGSHIAGRSVHNQHRLWRGWRMLRGDGGICIQGAHMCFTSYFTIWRSPHF